MPRKAKALPTRDTTTPINVPISLAKEQPSIPSLRAHDYDHGIVHESPPMPLGPMFARQHLNPANLTHKLSLRPFAHQLFPLRTNPILRNSRIR